MNAITLPELEQAGIVASIADGKLRLSAPAGRLTAELRDRIARQRDALLRELTRRQRQAAAGLRPHLLALANDEGLPAALVHALPDADVTACAGLPDDTLRAYLRALEAGQQMDAGMVPPGWGEPVACTCEGCGPVLLWPDCPPRVKACPWCARRKAGKVIPRPLVACGDCRHYLPDTVNPPAGMGGCALGPGRAYWPMKRHRCADWRARS